MAANRSLRRRCEREKFLKEAPRILAEVAFLRDESRQSPMGPRASLPIAVAALATRAARRACRSTPRPFTGCWQRTAEPAGRGVNPSVALRRGGRCMLIRYLIT